MDDTTPEMTLKMHELIQKKTPNERFNMGLSMNATARYLVIQGLLYQNPHITEAELKQQIFLKYYRDDFSSNEIKNILAYFSSHP